VVGVEARGERTTVEKKVPDTLNFPWAPVLVAVLFCQVLEAQTLPQQVQAIPANSPTASATTPFARIKIGASEHIDSATVHDAWLSYFSCLAVTTMAASTLLVALVIIRIQSISNSLINVEKSLHEAFYKIDRLDDYLGNTSQHSLNEHWTDYFKAVDELSERHEKLFPAGEKGRYHETRAFVNALVNQGQRLEAQNLFLQTRIPPIFAATAFVASIALLALPAVQWISPSVLFMAWIVSGVVWLLLLVLLIYIIKSAFRFK
jgi:hypothetical protein